MIVYENECVGCTGLGLHCIGDSCLNRKVPHYYCDWCKVEKGYDLYDVDGEMVCDECILGQYKKIDI